MSNKLSTEHGEIKLYIQLMMDIKARINFINVILEKKGTTGSEETDIEFCCLQLRKILELISLASLVMNKNEFENQRIKYEIFWNAKYILNDIERINPDFYPKAVGMKQDGIPTNETNIYDLTSGFLTKNELIAYYDKFGKILHSANPYGAKINYPYYKHVIKECGKKVIELLNLHIIKLYQSNDLYLVYLYNAKDEHVHATHLIGNQ